MAVLSDIHIGDNTPTVWYQRSVHEPYLVAALDWIVAHAEQFQEVVLLGDIIDTWTYPPSVRPPSMAAIIEANPEVLGPAGALSRVVDAVGTVTYVLGNHDGTVTAADLDVLRAAVGPLQLGEPVHVRTGRTGKRTVFSHGHHWGMFNAPDPASRWDTLPVGHFVTRAFSHLMAGYLAPGQTVADFKNQGYPVGFDIGRFLASLGTTRRRNLADLLLTYVVKASGLSEVEPIILPDGSETTIGEARVVYADLFTRWAAREGSRATAARAALADDKGDHMAWFAQRLALEHSADLVVFGHTHVPIGGLRVSPIRYVNNGFACGSVPDNATKEFTFTVVDLAGSSTDGPTADTRAAEDRPSAQVMKVDHATGAVSVAAPRTLPSVVLAPAMDFSCYVRIHNDSPAPLRLQRSSATDGHWVVPPPAEIPVGGRGDAWLQDHGGPAGSAGAFSYRGAGAELPFTVGCPTFGANHAAGAGGAFVARTGAGKLGAAGKVPASGHPLEVIFTVGGQP
ncbi:metallophosphoesterase [Frankia sp. QA3]|uniref:metallophosphoesterase n=1 Tax=Frankia sp. QA3 TaxID=710111 RepID=UPI0003051673|nr:metallophosphoesterase [Frankia sp. QA3]